MLTYHTYKVEIKDAPFLTKEDRSFPKTAIVTFYNKLGEIIMYREYGFLETKVIYDMIEEGKEINLDFCYIKNFSLKVYRLYNLLEFNKQVEIIGFSAKDAFFDSSYHIDFSYAKFSDKKISFINTQFASGDFSMVSCVFGNGGVDFSDTFFRHGDANFSKTNFGVGIVAFNDTVFNPGKIDFQYAVFGDTEVEFVNTLFNDGDTSFINAQFNNGGVSFRDAKFGTGKVDFRFAKFGKGDLSFDRTNFGDGFVDFRTVEIKTTKVTFSRSIFGDGEVSFEGLEMPKGRINFKRAIFGKGNINFEMIECENTKVFFDRTIFGEGSVSFLQSKFNTLSLVSCHIDYYLNLRLAYCEYVDLSDTIARDIIDLKPFDFNVDIKSINFSGIRLVGKIYIDWTKNNVKQVVLNQPNTSNDNLAEQFRILKENFNVTGQYNDEDMAYIEFKRFEAQDYLHKKLNQRKINKYWVYPSHWFRHLVFDLAGQYATNPMRVLLSMLVSYVFFSLVYLTFSFIPGTDVITGLDPEYQLHIVGKSFYISIITFLTIGYGEYVPIGALRIVAGIEGFVGLFLMSYFTVAFVRKILR